MGLSRPHRSRRWRVTHFTDMSHPLLTAAQPLNFRSRLQIPSFPPGQCITGPDSIRDWLETSTVATQTDGLLFQYTAGIMADARPEDRPFPRFMFDEEGRFIGLSLWVPDLQGWTVPGQIGELKTLQRVKTTVAEDISFRPLAGWRLCDGTTAGLPDFSAATSAAIIFTTPSNGAATVDVPSPWFSGTSPEWDRYTVGYVGA